MMRTVVVIALASIGAAFLLSVTAAAAWVIMRGRMKRRAGDSPVPGADQALDVGAQANAKPPAAGTPRPAPGPPFTERELRHLTKIDHWADGTCDPVRRQSAAVLADLFRTTFPHLSDDDLGRLLLNVSFVAREYGLTGTAGRLPGTLALAAGELTRLTRKDVNV